MRHCFPFSWQTKPNFHGVIGNGIQFQSQLLSASVDAHRIPLFQTNCNQSHYYLGHDEIPLHFRQSAVTVIITTLLLPLMMTWNRAFRKIMNAFQFYHPTISTYRPLPSGFCVRTTERWRLFFLCSRKWHRVHLLCCCCFQFLWFAFAIITFSIWYISAITGSHFAIATNTNVYDIFCSTLAVEDWISVVLRSMETGNTIIHPKCRQLFAITVYFRFFFSVSFERKVYRSGSHEWFSQYFFSRLVFHEKKCWIKQWCGYFGFIFRAYRKLCQI